MSVVLGRLIRQNIAWHPKTAPSKLEIVAILKPMRSDRHPMASGETQEAVKAVGRHYLTATPVRRLIGRLTVISAASIAASTFLRKEAFGELGGIAAFLIAASACWYCGPWLSLLSALIILHADRFARLGEAAFSSSYTVRELTNWFFYTVVLGVVGLAGKLTTRSMKELREREALLREQAHHKDRFLATLAHELRNPLAPLQSAIEVLQLTSESETSDPEVLREVHLTLRLQVQHLVHLVDDLLDVHRIAAGKIRLQREPAALLEIIQEAITTLKPQAQSAQHQMSVNDSTGSALIECDRTRLLQVFLNLLTNAVKFTTPGGRIVIDLTVDGIHAVVTVGDSGIGIPQEALPRVFESFTQIDNPMSQANRGLGLGLSLSRQLVELHGGTIHATSDGLGKGSQFIVRLPILQEKV